MEAPLLFDSPMDYYDVSQDYEGWTVLLWHGCGDSAYCETMTPPLKSEELARDMAAALNYGRQQRLLREQRKGQQP